MEKFIKLFGFKPAKQSDRHVEYRGFSDLDGQTMTASRILRDNNISYTSIEKRPQLKGFSIYF